MAIYDLKVNHLTNPLGFDLGTPVFSWKGDSDTYRLLVSKHDDLSEPLYDSGQTALNPLCAHAALSLEPRTRYYWAVSDGKSQSGTAWFETAKLEEAWEGKWIGCGHEETRHPIYSKEIKTKMEVKEARLYVCGLGLYEAFVNGTKVCDELLTPFCNDYNIWTQYQTWDITPLLTESFTVSVLLGNGWYGGRFGFDASLNTKPYYGDNWKLIAEVHLRYVDDSEEVIGTDESWSLTRSKLTFSNIYDGERVDETLQETGPEPAVLVEAPKGKLSARRSVPLKVREELPVKEIIHTPAGETVLDLGQNLAGTFRMRVCLPRGQALHLQFGEILQDGNFYRENLRTAKAEYWWISDGKEHVLQPKFTFYGYRYVKVEGTEPAAEDFTALVIYSEIPSIGTLTTGNELINQLIHNAAWGQKGNFLDVPTDCPQRDERMGWTGDAQVFAPTACYFTDCTAFYHKYLTDMNLEQETLDGAVPNVIPSVGVEGSSTAWGDAAVRIPWTVYQFSGDLDFLAAHYPGMRAWIDYCMREYQADRWLTQFHYGDWLALDGAGGEDPTGGTDTAFIALAYLIESTRITAQAAKCLEKEEEYQMLTEQRERLLSDLHQEYYSPNGRCCIDTQTAYVLTLAFHLHENREKAAEGLMNKLQQSEGHLKTGFVGTPLLCPTLSSLGKHENAYQLLFYEGFPGWLYEVKLGATTIWERWDSVGPDGKITSTGMNSLNHYSYGSIVEWLWRWAAGLESAAPGFTKAEIHPIPNWNLKNVDAVYDSVSGVYEVHWNCLSEEKLEVKAKVPYGCSALLTLPFAGEDAYQPVECSYGAAVTGHTLSAGTYIFRYQTTQPLRKHYSSSMTIRELLSSEKVKELFARIIPGFEQVPQTMYSMTMRQAAAMFAADKLNEEALDQIDKMLFVIDA